MTEEAAAARGRTRTAAYGVLRAYQKAQSQKSAGAAVDRTGAPRISRIYACRNGLPG